MCTFGLLTFCLVLHLAFICAASPYFASSFVPPPLFGRSKSLYVVPNFPLFLIPQHQPGVLSLFCSVLFCYLFIPLHYISVYLDLMHDWPIPLLIRIFNILYPYCHINLSTSNWYLINVIQSLATFVKLIVIIVCNFIIMSISTQCLLKYVS